MHVPVLLKETIEYLNAKSGKIFVDGTVGDGGHIFALASANTNSEILGIDLDQTSLNNLQNQVNQKGLSQKVKLVHGNFRDLEKFIETPVDGILLDLGFSSAQLDDPARGLSFQTDGPLDMRFDKSSPLTAEEVVNTYSEKDLERIITEYGEDRFAHQIASSIVKARKQEPIATTLELGSLIPHPDGRRRVFQAIRIEVNRELENLKEFLPKAMKLLNPSGRLVIISFHSLEDRIVKEFFNEKAKGCVCPPEFPVCVCGKASEARILTRKPVVATEEEIKSNPRSKPAKLRALEKI